MILPDLTPYSLRLFLNLADIPVQFVHHYTVRVNRPARPTMLRFGPHPRQYLLAWSPPAGVATRPVTVVFWHGGGWRMGWPGMFPAVPAFFLARGYPVVMPAYRLAPRYSHVHMSEDVDLALHATLEWRTGLGDADGRLLLAGMSAGATLAAHAAFDRARLARLGIPLERRAGFLSCAGPLDLQCMPAFRPVRLYAGGPHGSAAFQNANPIHYLDPAEDLPALLLHARTDGIVPYACSEAFVKAYPRAQLNALPGRTHLDSLRWATTDAHTADVLTRWLCSLEGL